MAETQQQAEARIRLRDPFPQSDHVNGATVEMTQARYDAWIVTSATNEIAGQVEAEAEATRKALRDAVKAQLARMDQIATFSGASTNALRDAAIKDLADFNRKLARILIQRGIIEP